VLPQRIGESEATNKLVMENKAEFIYNLEKFVLDFVGKSATKIETIKDDFLLFCAQNPSYDEALQKFPDRVFEAELSGEIEVKNGKIFT